MGEDGDERGNQSRSESQGGEARPNVVLITLDAGRYDLLAENLDSLPNLKALAAGFAEAERLHPQMPEFTRI